MAPLNAYAAAIEDLRSEPTEERDVEACRLHGPAIAHTLRASRWIRWYRERKLHALQRLHVELARQVSR